MAKRAQRFLSRRARWLVFAMLLTVGVYLLGVTPMHAYLQQRKQLHVAQQRYQVLASANSDLQQQSRQLQTDATIEQLARDRYELVLPGQQAYAVMPPAPAPASSATRHHHKSWWHSALDAVTFWS